MTRVVLHPIASGGHRPRRRGTPVSLARGRFNDQRATLPFRARNMAIITIRYGSHMKTTIEISDPVLNDARRLAAREGVTLRALVELGLRRLIAEKKRATGFRLRRASYKGNGLQAGLHQGASWERLREMTYEGHGR
jgi:hypothetical protein